MKQSIPDKALVITWALLWVLLSLSMRGTVLCLWLFGISVVVYLFHNKKIIIQREQVLTSVLFILFLLSQIASLLFDNDQSFWWKSLEKKSAFLIIPLLLLVVDQKNLDFEKWAIRGFISGLLIAGIVMSIAAFYRIISGELYTSWYYHELAAPFQHGAIYFSWYYSAALIYLVFKKQEPIIETIRPALIIFFLLILFLLASKLFIISTLPFILWKIVKQNRFKRRALISIAAVIIIVVAASSPFLLRMSELKNTDFEVLKQESFAYDTPFNGLTFRLLQWRFAKEILNQESAWLTGTGINSSQTVLNEHYAKSGVYTGNPDLEDKGYLEYNFHNQYLETLVSTGIPGLVILLLIILNIFFNRRYKLLFPLPVLIITTLFFFTESVLERQAGIMFFCITVLTLTNNKVTEWK